MDNKFNPNANKPADETIPETNAAPPETDDVKTVRTKTALNYRKTKSAENDKNIAGVLGGKESVIIYKEEDGWGQIKVKDEPYWIKLEFTEEVE